MADTLERYREKRDFARTSEPSAEAAAESGRRFVVQMHAARRLHWDFRLELDGTLKSWAVTRGPSADPDDKRLAVRTEDHPIAYADFEGVIPKGEYGGGNVMLWDEGQWTPHPGKDPVNTLEEGHLHFTLDGARMRGEWILIRLKTRPGERGENWLLRKVADEAAGGDLAAAFDTSVRSGRTLAEIGAGHVPKAAKKVPGTAKSLKLAGKARGAPPPFRAPQLATLAERPPAGPAWAHEIKHDGYRCLLAVGGGRAIAYTRSGLDWSDRFAEVVEAGAALPCNSALMDGEVVANDAEGRSRFSLLQSRLKEGGPLAMQVFDLLELDGEDLTPLPLDTRKAKLKALLAGAPSPLFYSDHVIDHGEAMFAEAGRMGLEGIVSKRLDAPYRSGRGTSWLKVKATRRQEFVIVGWLSSDKRRGFRSLLLAVREEGALRYAGKVGTGFNAADMDALMEAMEPLSVAEASVKAPRAETRGARWIAPRLVAEVAFAEWTADNMLRHASFLGLREDKPADEVVAERPLLVAPPGISSPDRLIFPEAGITKGMLAAYYERMAPYLLAEGGGRPISLVRCPGGREKACFFQRHDAGGFGDAVKTLVDPAKPDERWIYVEDAAGLLACAQMGTIELHGWGSRVATLERPDRLVFDLDPDEGLDFRDVVAAAVDIRAQLRELGLETLPMLSGGKGVHVIAHLDASAEWPAVKDFARRFALALEGAAPERYTASMSKARRRGRIFVDWLRNQRGATSVLPWSVRSRPGAPVAVPVTWGELNSVDAANLWTLLDVETLAGRAAMPRSDKAQPLPDL